MSDWQAKIADIRAAYFEDQGRELTDYKLGLMLGIGARSVERIRLGLTVDPKGTICAAIEREHAKIASNLHHVSHETSLNQA